MQAGPSMDVRAARGRSIRVPFPRCSAVPAAAGDYSDTHIAVAAVLPMVYARKNRAENKTQAQYEGRGSRFHGCLRIWAHFCSA